MERGTTEEHEHEVVGGAKEQRGQRGRAACLQLLLELLLERVQVVGEPARLGRAERLRSQQIGRADQKQIRRRSPGCGRVVASGPRLGRRWGGGGAEVGRRSGPGEGGGVCLLVQVELVLLELELRLQPLHLLAALARGLELRRQARQRLLARRELRRRGSGCGEGGGGVYEPRRWSTRWRWWWRRRRVRGVVAEGAGRGGTCCRSEASWPSRQRIELFDLGREPPVSVPFGS
jgi:hypothetical protein